MAFAVSFRAGLTVVFTGCMLYVVALGMQSYVAQGLLEFLNNEENIFHISSGYWLMVMMTGSSLVAVLSLNYVFFLSARIGVSMRSLTMSLIYAKSLRLSCEARQEYTPGEALTLMSVDTEREFNLLAHGPWLVMGPLGFAISIILVGVLFDFYSSVLIVVMTLSVQQGDRIARLQKQLLKVIDEREGHVGGSVSYEYPIFGLLINDDSSHI
ncbi:putative metal resistance protein YCF1 [Phytophthora infestans]|uniref:Putative metal resistance protein YCF1 n=1 Tax=Phytophthora infestans TaxID=4787 RepID=A0A8S9VB04_PHYIN|nr:putative metal resistance protein YCF1 [Phytophthora infestans]